MLKCENLMFQYSRTGAPVLRGLSLELEQGQIGIVLGKNGSGQNKANLRIFYIDKVLLIKV